MGKIIFCNIYDILLEFFFCPSILKMSEDNIVLKLMILKLIKMTKAKSFASISEKTVGRFQGSRKHPWCENRAWKSGILLISTNQELVKM